MHIRYLYVAIHADPSKPTVMSSFSQFIHKVSQKEMERCGAMIPGTDNVSAVGLVPVLLEVLVGPRGMVLLQ